MISSCTAKQAITYILKQSPDWTVGTIDYTDSNPYKFDGDTLYDALETVSDSLDEPVVLKDNVFFLVRSGSDGAQVVKYGDRVKRIENKKSEVFASNYVKGTAPRYANVRALRDRVAKGVDNG